MEELSFRSRHVPAFGSWDCGGDDLPFTQCFEQARQAELLRCSYSEDRDLYVDGDLYENDVVTPAMIVVPRHRRKVVYPKDNESEKDEWFLCNCECDLKTPLSPVPALVAAPLHGRWLPPKAVDEDLYRISPELMRAQKKRRRGWGYFLSFLRRPACLC